jgi:hypothetical protein
MFIAFIKAFWQMRVTMDAGRQTFLDETQLQLAPQNGTPLYKAYPVLPYSKKTMRHFKSL